VGRKGGQRGERPATFPRSPPNKEKERGEEGRGGFERSKVSGGLLGMNGARRDVGEG